MPARDTQLSRREVVKLAGATAIGLTATATLTTRTSIAQAADAPGTAADSTNGSTGAQARATTPAETPTVASPTNSDAMRRADDLLRRMTVEEKAMQLSCVFPVGLFDSNGPVTSQLDAQLGKASGTSARSA